VKRLPALMVQGTSSWAGKSLLATVLCRHFARAGLRVAPFKAQNMSNNARVVAGGEIGTAQWLQARAAGIEPDVRMNPVLVKPEGETRSQVIVLGQAHRELSDAEWRERPPSLWPVIEDAYCSLAADVDLVVIEGAGSPAEINLRDTDLANMAMARLADAPVLLVCDIDRGGAFAHLYGTWALLDEDDRARIAGFVLNRFRGDAELLAPAPAMLSELTGVPTLGVVPMVAHGLPDEDGAAPDSPGARPGAPRVAIVRYPTASNLDEFKPLEQVATVIWAARPRDLEGCDLVILPGSKHVAADLAWLRERGLEPALRAHCDAGGMLLGVCGGLQMLGAELADRSGRDGDARGLGMLPLRTTLGPEKLLAQRTRATFAALDGAWARLAGLEVVGYEIRHGATEPAADASAAGDARGEVAGRAGSAALTAGDAAILALPGGLGWAKGPVLGVYLHGLLEDPAVVEALLGRRPARSLDDAIDELTDRVMAHLDVQRVNCLASSAGSRPGSEREARSS
jgi:adenosylcobyric acid synthase